MRSAEFYALAGGDDFGDTEGRPHPHRGKDYPWGAGTAIPSWCDGVVVLNAHSVELGNMVGIRSSEGFAGHSHMMRPSPLPVGTVVKFDDIVGVVGNTGTASRGAHDHTTFSLTGANPATARVVDPVPYITESIKSRKKARPVLQFNQNPTDKKTADGKPVYYIAGAGGVFRHVFSSQSLADSALVTVKNGDTLLPSTFGLTSDAAGWATLVSWQTPPSVAVTPGKPGEFVLQLSGTAKPA